MTIALANAGNTVSWTPQPPEMQPYMSEVQVRHFIGSEVAKATEHLRTPQHMAYVQGLWQDPNNVANQAELIGNGYGAPVSRMPTVPGRQGAGHQGIRQPAQALGQIVRALAACKGDLFRAQQWAMQEWPHDETIHRALAASTMSQGGILIDTEVIGDVLPILRSRTVMRSLGVMEVPMPTGVAMIPKLTEGMEAEWVGENQGHEATDVEFGDIMLTWKMLRTDAAISATLLQQAAFNADTIVRNDMIGAMMVAEDRAFLRGDGTEFSPKGLLNWVNTTLAASTFPVATDVEGRIAAITNDMNALILALEDNDVPMPSPGIIMAPRTRQFLSTFRSQLGALVWPEINDLGTFFGIPLRHTTSIPKNIGTGGNRSEIMLFETTDAVIGDSMQMEIDASNTATYTQGGQMRSAWDRFQVAIRGITQVDFAMRRPESGAVLNEVPWGNSV